MQAGEVEEKWLGIECCPFHISLTKDARACKDHSLYVDDTLLTLAATKASAGLAFLPCFMGDSEASLVRYQPPDAKHDLGLWLVYHRDLRRTKRIRLFRDHMIQEIAATAALLNGNFAQ